MMKVNFIIILGVILVACGTYLSIIGSSKQKDFLIISGVIIVGIGTYLTILGSQKKSNKSEIRIINEIEKTRLLTESKIENILATNISSEQRKEIKILKNEFNEWADSFKNNIEKKRIEYQKAELLDLEDILKLNNEWKSIYSGFFTNSRKIIDALNSNLECKILYEIPELPINIFTKKYSALIEFQNNISWEISFNPPNLEDSILATPIIAIRIFKKYHGDNHSQRLQDLFLLIMKDLKTDKPIISFKSYYGNYLNINTIRKNHSISYEPTIKNFSEIFKTLIELQIIKEGLPNN